MAHLSNICTTDLVTILAGPSRTPMRIHLGALLPLSDYFRGLFQADYGLQESRTLTVDFSHYLEDDIDRFCTYVYGGDYAAPHSTTEEGPSYPPGVEQEELDWNQSFTTSRATKKAVVPVVQDQRAELDKHFTKIRYCKKTPHQSYGKMCQIENHQSEMHSLEEVFLAHARLYAFAKEKLIHELTKLCLQKLHDTLSTFQLNEHRYNDILTLTRFAHSEEYDELQDLVVRYHGSKFFMIGGFAGFKKLVREEGTFSENLLRLLYLTFPGNGNKDKP